MCPFVFYSTWYNLFPIRCQLFYTYGEKTAMLIWERSHEHGLICNVPEKILENTIGRHIKKFSSVQLQSRPACIVDAQVEKQAGKFL